MLLTRRIILIQSQAKILNKLMSSSIQFAQYQKSKISSNIRWFYTTYKTRKDMRATNEQTILNYKSSYR